MTNMNTDFLLSILIPVYNEVHSLEAILRRVSETPYKKQIILVDDASTDGSREILKEIEKSGKLSSPECFLTFLYHEKNQGKGAALRTGISAIKGDIVLIQDADLEYDPSEYGKILEPILKGDADVVYGSRFMGGEPRRVLFFWHMIGNKMLTLFSNMTTNLNLTDMETGFKVFKASVLQSIPIRSDRFGFEPEITAKISKLRCRVFEVPISYKGRSYSEGKKIGWKDGVSAFWTILKFWFIEDLFRETVGLRTLRIMEGAGTYNKWLFEQCVPYLGQKIAETGCGVGNITKLLIGKAKVLATDFEDTYLKELSMTFKDAPEFDVGKWDLLKEEDAQKINKTFSPDTVLSMNVLEHIQDDQTSLKNIQSALVEGGRLVLVVPAHSYLYSEMDKNLGHFRRYNQASLVELVEKSGFIIEKSAYLNFLGALGWFFNGKIIRKSVLPSRQVRLFDFLVKLLFIEKFISLPFGLSLLIVARKKNS